MTFTLRTLQPRFPDSHLDEQEAERLELLSVGVLSSYGIHIDRVVSKSRLSIPSPRGQVLVESIETWGDVLEENSIPISRLVDELILVTFPVSNFEGRFRLVPLENTLLRGSDSTKLGTRLVSYFVAVVAFLVWLGAGGCALAAWKYQEAPKEFGVAGFFLFLILPLAWLHGRRRASSLRSDINSNIERLKMLGITNPNLKDHSVWSDKFGPQIATPVSFCLELQSLLKPLEANFFAENSKVYLCLMNRPLRSDLGQRALDRLVKRLTS